MLKLPIIVQGPCLLGLLQRYPAVTSCIRRCRRRAEDTSRHGQTHPSCTSHPRQKEEGQTEGQHHWERERRQVSGLQYERCFADRRRSSSCSGRFPGYHPLRWHCLESMMYTLSCHLLPVSLLSTVHIALAHIPPPPSVIVV